MCSDVTTREGDEPRTEADVPWFLEWFGEDYLALYPHRDEEEAGRSVELFLDHFAPGPNARVLDLACGAGRHLVRLDGAGLRGTGLDLSMPLLTTAQSARGDLRLTRGDMRYLPYGTGVFDLVTNFFTSFGYFDEESDDRRVLAEIARVLRPGGGFLMDFLNAELVKRTLRPEDERTVGDRHVYQRRRLIGQDRIVEKEIEIVDGNGVSRTYFERVRLYGVEELQAVLEASGLTPERRAGDYDGSPFTADSPRCIILGRVG